MNVTNIKQSAQDNFAAAKAAMTSSKVKTAAVETGKTAALVVGLGVCLGAVHAIYTKTSTLLGC